MGHGTDEVTHPSFHGAPGQHHTHPSSHGHHQLTDPSHAHVYDQYGNQPHSQHHHSHGHGHGNGYGHQVRVLKLRIRGYP